MFQSKEVPLFEFKNQGQQYELKMNSNTNKPKRNNKWTFEDIDDQSEIDFLKRDWIKVTSRSSSSELNGNYELESENVFPLYKKENNPDITLSYSSEVKQWQFSKTATDTSERSIILAISSPGK